MPNKNKNRLHTISANIQFCYPNYKEMQKRLGLKGMRKITQQRNKKVNPFLFKVIKYKKRNV